MRQLMGQRGDQLLRIIQQPVANSDHRRPARDIQPRRVGQLLLGAQLQLHAAAVDAHVVAELREDRKRARLGTRHDAGKMLVGRQDHSSLQQALQAEILGQPLHPRLDPGLLGGPQRRFRLEETKHGAAKGYSRARNMVENANPNREAAHSISDTMPGTALTNQGFCSSRPDSVLRTPRPMHCNLIL